MGTCLRNGQTQVWTLLELNSPSKLILRLQFQRILIWCFPKLHKLDATNRNLIGSRKIKTQNERIFGCQHWVAVIRRVTEFTELGWSSSHAGVENTRWPLTHQRARTLLFSIDSQQSTTWRLRTPLRDYLVCIYLAKVVFYLFTSHTCT